MTKREDAINQMFILLMAQYAPKGIARPGTKEFANWFNSSTSIALVQRLRLEALED